MRHSRLVLSMSALSSAWSWIYSWRPTPEQAMAEAERKVMQGVESDYEELFVEVGEDEYIHTVVFEANDSLQESVPLVMLHGFACGIPQYYKNYDHLHATRCVYSLDLPGFARSSRVNFTPDPVECEREFVKYLEKWRQAVGLEQFILLGHSFGGFVSCAYAICYPQHENGPQLPIWAVLIGSFLMRFNPLTPVRLAGPLGPYLLPRVRPDLSRIFGEDFMNYVYHINVQKPSGETAFFHMQIPFGWARCPMLNRAALELSKSVPLSCIYGARSWMDNQSGEKLAELRSDVYTKVHTVQGAGHHVHAERPQEFNRIVNNICSLVDTNSDAI